MTSKPLPRRRWLQFGIGTLLFLTLLVAGYLSGFRIGYSGGRQASARPDVQADEALLTIVYQLGDLAGPLPTQPNEPANTTIGNALVKHIQTTISPSAWKQGGGRCSLEYSGADRSILVSATRDTHKQVADFLQHCWQLQQDGKDEELQSILSSTQD